MHLGIRGRERLEIRRLRAQRKLVMRDRGLRPKPKGQGEQNQRHEPIGPAARAKWQSRPDQPSEAKKQSANQQQTNQLERSERHPGHVPVLGFGGQPPTGNQHQPGQRQQGRTGDERRAPGKTLSAGRGQPVEQGKLAWENAQSKKQKTGTLKI